MATYEPIAFLDIFLKAGFRLKPQPTICVLLAQILSGRTKDTMEAGVQ